MGKDTMDLAADYVVEAILRDELARETRALSAVVPVLRHLLGSEAQILVSDVILARVRGMIGDLAAQLVALHAGYDPATRTAGIDPAAHDRFAETLMADEVLLAFCHALATESLIAERLQQSHGIDPVLSPLLQELIASEDAAVAGLAMRTLAAQSRFVQSQRRMQLPLGELPAELFHALLTRAQSGALGAADGGADMAQMQRAYDEASSRLGLLARLIAGLRRGALAALVLDHAGIALFAAALASVTRTSRPAAVLACHEGQGVRFALLLRAAGLAPPAIERQVLIIEPDARLPRALAELPAERAAALLAAGGPE